MKIRFMLAAGTLAAALLLAGCSASSASSASSTASRTPASSAAVSQETASSETEAQTLESLLGSDYVDYISETILMNMENRMDLEPEVEYYPVVNDAPLTDYVTIDEHLPFEVNQDGDRVINFDAGVVADTGRCEEFFILAAPNKECFHKKGHPPLPQFLFSLF